ncbi:ABC transporter permease [Virgibacillus xinjiangensis]|uniref:ABC transporter permease n=1 Tax=Virgibacillus xinjiangensis TaxID=393090 RepID=A0ABV7CS27_9BACI
MSQWLTLFQKEMLENWRNKKWIWVPLVILLIAVMDPITNYYMPVIIESVGGLPEGASIQLPEYTPPDVVLMSLGQLSSLGVLVLVLMSMGAISGERKSGIAEMVLVKPVSHLSYITAKWASLLLLVWTSLFLGMLASWYYINILFGSLAWTDFLLIVFFYGLWLTLVISLSIFYNSLLKTPGLVAACTILTIMLMSLITRIFETYLTWSPSRMTSHIHDMLVTGDVTSDLLLTGLITITVCAALLAGSIAAFRTRELAE